MKILAKEKLSEHKYKTPEGYLICVDSVLARTGKQTYTRDELFHDGDETEIEVDRTPEEVFSDATLASFENKPLVVEHPDEDVNSTNNKEYAVGFVRDVKRGELDGEPVMLGTLVITDEQTIKEIEDGEHTDLSCGYDCDIQDEAEPSQKNIRGNHVALCQTGRAGIARIVDSVNDASYEVELFPTDGANSLVSHFDLLTKAYKFAEDQTTAGKYKKITISKPGFGIVNQWDKSTGWKTKYEFRKRKDSVKDMDKTTAMKTIEKMLEDPRYGRRSYDDILYLNKEGLAKIREIALSAGLTQKDLASIDPWVFGKGTGYQIIDSIKDSQFEEYMRKLAYIDEYWQVSKMLDRAYNELPTDDYKRLYKAAQERKKEILAMHDSNTNDKLIESGSEEAFKKNIATEIRAGKDPKQAAAIAYSVQRENDSDVKDVVQFDALKDAPNKSYAITKIKEIIKNPRYTSEDNEGVVYLTQEGYKLVQQLAKSNGLDRKDMENISWYMFGPGGYPSIVDSDEKVEDAMEKYYIRWIDQYSKSKGYDKSFWLHDDEVKANSAKEALDKLANIAVRRGVGTRYVTIVNIKTDKTSYQVSGNIDDLRKRQLDSMSSTYERATRGLKTQLNNVGDSKRVGKYKVTKIK